MSNTTASWRGELKDWIKNQHGTAGWEQKLENFIEKVEQEAYERGRRDNGMTVKVTFTEDSPFKGMTETLENITEIHYCYPSPVGPRTAFESDIDGAGFTYDNKYIKEFEALTKPTEQE